MTTAEKEALRRVQQCRRDTLTTLGVRAPNALTLAHLRAAIRREFGTDYAEEEIAAAVSFLNRTDPPEVEEVRDRHGTEHSYRTTPAGQLIHEEGFAR